MISAACLFPEFLLVHIWLFMILFDRKTDTVLLISQNYIGTNIIIARISIYKEYVQ